jgi:hypothetical protein
LRIITDIMVDGSIVIDTLDIAGVAGTGMDGNARVDRWQHDGIMKES